MQPKLPAGLTPEIIQQLQVYFKQLPKPKPAKVSGLLPLSEIRGHDPNARYEFREYPKMIRPPPVTVMSIIEEKRFNKANGIKLRQEREVAKKVKSGEVNYLQEYWDLREYPKTLWPKSIKVWSAEEENGVLAAWASARPTPAAGPNYAQGRWFFHASKEPVLVHSLREEQDLAAGYKPTIQEAFADAMAALQPQVPPTPHRKAKNALATSPEAAEAA